jgi:hypothetical protein
VGIHNWEPDIYIGFSPALHLQCSEECYLRVQITNIFVEVTMGLMLSCALLITAVQLVTDPIICDVKVKISIFIFIIMETYENKQ